MLRRQMSIVSRDHGTTTSALVHTRTAPHQPRPRPTGPAAAARLPGSCPPPGRCAHPGWQGPSEEPGWCRRPQRRSCWARRPPRQSRQLPAGRGRWVARGGCQVNGGTCAITAPRRRQQRVGNSRCACAACMSLAPLMSAVQPGQPSPAAHLQHVLVEHAARATQCKGQGQVAAARGVRQRRPQPYQHLQGVGGPGGKKGIVYSPLQCVCTYGCTCLSEDRV